MLAAKLSHGGKNAHQTPFPTRQNRPSHSPKRRDGRLRHLRKRLRRRFKHRPGLVPWLAWLPQRAFLALLGLLPDRAALWLGDRLGRLALVSSRRRRIGREHLAAAFPDLAPDERDHVLRDSCGHLGRSAVEILVLSERHRGDFDARVELEPGAAEVLASARGKGAVVVVGHLGAFEICGAVLARHGLDPAFPMREPNNWYLARRLRRSREGWGVRLVDRHGAVRVLTGHLARGGAAVLATDQYAHTKPVHVSWFGRPAATERAAAALALRRGSPVLVSWCLRTEEPARWRFGCTLVRDAAAPVRRPDEAAVAELTESVHRELEAAIRRAPEQYLWIHDRYRTPPPAAGGEEADRDRA